MCIGSLQEKVVWRVLKVLHQVKEKPKEKLQI